VDVEKESLEKQEKIKGYSMTTKIITCAFKFGIAKPVIVQVTLNGYNTANIIESAIIKKFKEIHPEESGTILVQSFKCKDINNGLNLHDYENRIINENELITNKVYDFEVEAIFTRAEFGGRRRSRRSRKSRKSRKSRRR
jgi:hypothetical protein